MLGGDDRAVREALARRKALLELPSWLWGGKPSGIAHATRWHLETVASDTRVWSVQLAERRARRAGRLVKLRKMAHAGNVDSPGTFSALSELGVDASAGLDHQAINEKLNRMAETLSGLGPAMYAATVATTASPQEALPALVRDVMKEQFLPLLPGSTAWLLLVDRALTMRFAMTRVLLLAQEDPNLLQRKLDLEHRTVFDSARGLFSDTLFGLNSYISPLLLSLSPEVVGVAGPRAGGVIIYTFGQPIPGRSPTASEVLQLFYPGADRTASVSEGLLPGDTEAALAWWVTQLDKLFTEVTDPCNFRTQDSRFSFRGQFEVLLSVEQAFRNLQSLLASSRDSHSRRVLFFDTLDTLEGLHLGTFDRMLHHSHAYDTLQSLAGIMPEAAARLLLPRAQRAVDALAKLQEGFFLQSRLVTHGIRLPDKRQGERVVTLESATAMWLRVLRNAGHSFGGRTGNNERDDALLAAHDGEIPPELPDLAFLYLIALVAEPRRLRNVRGDKRLDVGTALIPGS